MKKVLILTATALTLGFATPMFANAVKTQDEIALTQEKEVKYTEIKVEELPDEVTKSIASAYVGYKVDKAFKGDDASFKVKVSMGDLKYVLFYSAKGELVKVEEPTGDKK